MCESCSSIFAGQGVRVFYPSREFCADNGAMVAYTRFCRLSQGCSDDLKISVMLRWLITAVE